jgi:hypothetical protein
MEVPETCPVTGKVRYGRKIRALLAVVKIEEVGPKEMGGAIPKRAYRCPHCRGWHLTSQEQRSPATS